MSRFGDMGRPDATEQEQETSGIVDAWIGLFACSLSAGVSVAAFYGVWVLIQELLK